MTFKNILNLKHLFCFLILFIFSTQENANTEKEQNYFFTMYSSQNNQTPYILYANTPFSEFLTINASDSKNINIKKENTSEYIYKNISSVLLYEKDYLVKTCFGPNKIMEIISQDNIGKKETQNKEYIYTSNVENYIENNVVFCYSSIIKNPDNKYQDKKAIITFLTEKNENKENSKIEYSYKALLFYPNSKDFSSIYSLNSEDSSYFINVFPKYCTTFKETCIYCTINDDKNQLILETNKIIKDTKINPSIYAIKSVLDAGDTKNLRPISLKSEYQSLTGGYYDKFIIEYHDKEKNETSLYSSLYRKSVHYSLVPKIGSIEITNGIFIKYNYIGFNLLNIHVPYSDEAVLVYIYNNTLKVKRIDYSNKRAKLQILSQDSTSSYITKIDPKCKYPKFLQSTYVNNYIKYNELDQAIVNKNKNSHYIYQKDLEILLSCSNSENEENSEVVYTSKIISLPQCLIDLDSIHGFGIHRINFYIDIETIIYDIYADPRLKSFRNVGIIFYQIEQYFIALLFPQIKRSEDTEFFVPKPNTLYLNVTHIRFERVNPNYVPYLRRPFYFYYRLMELNLNNNDKDTIDTMTSNLCSFQIKFFPYKSTYGQSHGEIDFNIDKETCTVDFCAVCTDNNANSCKICDTSEISTLVLDKDLDSNSYNICVCDPELGFLKEPNLEYNLCLCQEDYYYYKSIKLCWPKEKLENGPYYKQGEDDYTHTPVYDDCYYTCKKCSKAKDEYSHNCLQCQDGYAYIDDDITNCYDINDFDDGYHQVDDDHFIKCHENCVSCSEKFTDDKQFCTECKNYVPFMLKENLLDEYFNCLENNCDLNDPSLLFAYNENSYQCIKDCKDGVQPYNLTNVCWESCGKDYFFLDEESKKCYTICSKNENNGNIYSNYALGTCSKECSGEISTDKICLECDGEERKYKSKNEDCVEIPKECLIVDINTGLCKICNNGYYPLKGDLNKGSFNCYGTLEDIIEKTNKTNYYFNDTGNYWDECYVSCQTCDSYGSENRQRCKTCKPGYHFPVYFENKYNNCKENLSSYDNCTSTQEDIYKYKDYCHFCNEGYSFVYNTDKCRKDEELKNGSFYEDTIKIIKDYNTNETTEVKIYYPCHKNCKTCKGKGDYYNNNCLECKKGYEFDINNKKKTCIKSDEDEDYDKDGLKTEDIWFKLGEEIFYIYREKKCFFIYYEKEIILISNENDCNSICPDWTNSIEESTCVFKDYSTFNNMTREYFNKLKSDAYIYEEIKSDVNIVINKPEKRLCFHITNFVSQSPKNLSTIHIEEYETDIKKYYNLSLNDRILAMKVDIKKEGFRSTQVEYGFYHPKKLGNLDLDLPLFYRRRLDGDGNNENFKLKLDLPVDWTDEELSRINELSDKGINAFNSSDEFYLDNCNQYTTNSNKDAYLEDRKKDYYPNLELCEEGCNFVEYNQETEKITCQCDYKSTTDNYENIKLVKNPVDKKFKKKNFLENLQSMKCISKIFKPENLKKNPGFFIMIFFLLVFVVSGIFYYLSGFNKIRTQIFQIHHQNLHESDKKVDSNGVNENKNDNNKEPDNINKNPENPEIKKNSNDNMTKLNGNKIEINTGKKDEGGEKKNKDEILSINKKSEDNNLINNNENEENQNNNDNNDKNDEQLIDTEKRNIHRKFSDSFGRNQIDYSKEDDSVYGEGHVKIENDDLMKVKKNIDKNNNGININLHKNKLPPITKKEEVKEQNHNLFDKKSEDSEDMSYNIDKEKESTNNQDSKNDKNEKNSGNNLIDKSSNNSNEKINIENLKIKNSMFESKNKLNEVKNSMFESKNKLNEEEKNAEEKSSKGKKNLIENDLDDDSLEFNNINNKGNGIIFNDKKEDNSKKSDKNKLNNFSETSSNYDYRRRNDNIDVYDRDFDQKIEESEDKEYDIISDIDKGSISNPPKKSENREIFCINKDFRSSDYFTSSERKNLNHEKRNNMNYLSKKKKCCCVSIIQKCGSLCGKGDYSDSEEIFKDLYIADLKKHHIIYFTFFKLEKNVFLLKLSFFAFSTHLYFGLNTILTFNLSMAESYFDKKNSKPGFIAMNLLLPFVIVGLISFVIKIIIMPKYYLERAEKKLDELKQRMNISDNMKEEPKKEQKVIEIPQEEPKQKKHKRDLKNKKKEDKKIEIPPPENEVNLYNKKYEIEKEALKQSLYEKYLKLVTIYFVICLLIILFNSYMMTSFCSIYRNTGVKLLVNSFVSLGIGLIIPFVLGLIPTFIGFLAKKTGNKVLDKIYLLINFII